MKHCSALLNHHCSPCRQFGKFCLCRIVCEFLSEACSLWAGNRDRGITGSMLEKPCPARSDARLSERSFNLRLTAERRMHYTEHTLLVPSVGSAEDQKVAGQQYCAKVAVVQLLLPPTPQIFLLSLRTFSWTSAFCMREVCSESLYAARRGLQQGHNSPSSPSTTTTGGWESIRWRRPRSPSVIVWKARANERRFSVWASSCCKLRAGRDPFCVSMWMVCVCVCVFHVASLSIQVCLCLCPEAVDPSLSA